MSENKLGIFGDKDVALAFRALGFELMENLDDIESYALVLVTQTEYKQHEAQLEKYIDNPYPIILAIPDGREKAGESIKKIVKNMERAVGSSTALKN